MKVKKCVLLILVSVIFLTACGTSNGNIEKFDLSLDEPEIEVECGQEVKYIAKLSNKTEKECKIYHGSPLITLYVYPEENIPEEEGIGSNLVETVIKGNGTIKKEITVCFTEKGVYYLRAFASFEFDGKEYFYDKEPIKISVE